MPKDLTLGRRVTRRTWLAACGAVAMGAFAQAEPHSEASRRLFEAGLVRQGRFTWTTRAVADIERRLSELPGQIEKMKLGDAAFSELVGRHLEVWRQWQASAPVYEAQLKALALSDSQRAKIQKQRDGLRRRAIDPQRLGAEPTVQSLAIDLTAARLDVLGSIFAIRSRSDAAIAEHQRLAADEPIAQWLAELGADQRFARLQTGAWRLDRLADFEREVARVSPPVYLVAGRLRFGAIVDDRLPITFSWSEASEPAWITTAQSAAAGIAADETTPPMLIEAGGERVSARIATIATLRLAPLVVRDTRVFILPPSAEHLGAQLSAAALPGYRIEPDRTVWRLRLEA